MDETFNWTESKYNEDVILTPEDKKNRVKIFCKEPYAQELYDAMVDAETNQQRVPCKDLAIDQLYSVTAKSIDFDNKLITAEEIESMASVNIPFREFSRDPQSLLEGDRTFNAIIIREKDGEFVASEKKSLVITYKQELFDNYHNNKYFDVKVERLIKGGYLAKYKDSISCFIPGGLAAANVIHDFQKYLGTEITVMIENYDSTNDLFITSYKKYIKHTMPRRITDLSFNTEYTGILTNHPYDFGMFVEFDNFFTGLIHKSEFENYAEIRKTYTTGQEISFFIKDVSNRKGEYRIFLTRNIDGVNKEKLHWSNIKDKAENGIFEFDVDENKNRIKINVDGEDLEIGLRRRDVKRNIRRYPFIKVSKVDPINRKFKFDFITQRVETAQNT